MICDKLPSKTETEYETRTESEQDGKDHKGHPKSLAASSGDVNDMGERGGYSPSATASSCENGGREPDRVCRAVNVGCVDTSARIVTARRMPVLTTLKMGLIADLGASPGLEG